MDINFLAAKFFLPTILLLSGKIFKVRKMKKWIINKNDADLELMSKVLKIDRQIANILANRNIRTKNTAIKFLNPNLKFLHDTRAMKDMDKLIDIIKIAIAEHKKITVYGDYDVDGVMSTVILFKTLLKINADVDFYLPSRTDDGFGLNINAIDKIYKNGTKLIITCDNGIAAIKEIEYAKKLGMKIIIIDHHTPNTYGEKDILPKADAIVDNKQKDCQYPFKMLCAGGMAYKISKLLLDEFDIKFDDDFLAFAAIATLCDVVPLIDENRIIAKCGLDLINNKKIKNKGLISLLKFNKICNRKINADDIAFIIGPCINACGRIKSANLAAKLFLTEDEELAFEICQLNDERKIMTKDACCEIFQELENYDLIQNPVIVYYNNNIAESIAGIVAGKIKEKYYHPVIFFTDSNNIIKGSARSIDGYNMFDELQKCRDLFLKFGGHTMAAGISMQKENFDLLSEKLNSNCQLSSDDFVAKIDIDAKLDIDKINYDIAKKLMVLAPFGHKNREPLFICQNVHVEKLNAIEDKNTLIFSLCKNKKSIKAICFGMYEQFHEQLLFHYDNYESVKVLNGVLKDIDLVLDIVYSIEINEFNNDACLQLRLKDFMIEGD